MAKSDLEFFGVQWLDIDKLKLSQIYLNADKLNQIADWFCPTDLSKLSPLPVHDFGNGQLTLTDGHSRAYTAYMSGVMQVPVIYDYDELVTCETGQLLYRNDIIWCERFGIHSVRDLKDRILSDSDYQTLWIGRCDKAYHLLTKTSELQRLLWSRLYPDLYLFGASSDLLTLYFEDDNGKAYSISTG